MAWYEMNAGGIPASLKSDMNSVLNKKFGTVSQDYPPNGWPADVNLMGPLPEKTASGAIASFPDGADTVPVKSCTVAFGPGGGGGTPADPVPLVGYNSVNVVKTGKNLFDKTNPNVVSGYISTTGFSDANQNAKTVYIAIKPGATYTVSKTAGQRFQIATSDVIPSNTATYTNRVAQSGSQPSLTITAGANDIYLWAWVFLDGTDTGTLTEMLASVQIETGSTATAYKPYVTPETISDSFG